MNLGFSGPIEEREGVVVKDRIGIEVDDGRHRDRELNELLLSEGGMLAVTRAEVRLGVVAFDVVEDKMFSSIYGGRDLPPMSLLKMPARV